MQLSRSCASPGSAQQHVCWASSLTSLQIWHVAGMEWTSVDACGVARKHALHINALHSLAASTASLRRHGDESAGWPWAPSPLLAAQMWMSLSWSHFCRSWTCRTVRRQKLGSLPPYLALVVAGAVALCLMVSWLSEAGKALRR